MKSQALAIALLFSAAGAPFACAADGTINFYGELTSQTCTILVNGVATPAVAAVTLPTVSTASLTSAGQTSGATGFNIELANCTWHNKTAAAFFESGSTVDPFNGNLKNTSLGGATNVELQLLDGANGSAIMAGNTNQITNTTRYDFGATGSATMPYAVQYYATGVTTGGPVVSSVTYSINYQ